jgi:hypothetical protein
VEGSPRAENEVARPDSAVNAAGGGSGAGPGGGAALSGGRRPRACRTRGSASPFYGDAGLEALACTPSRGPVAAAAMACLGRWALAGLAAGPARVGSGPWARPNPVG